MEGEQLQQATAVFYKVRQKLQPRVVLYQERNRLKDQMKTTNKEIKVEAFAGDIKILQKRKLDSFRKVFNSMAHRNTSLSLTQINRNTLRKHTRSNTQMFNS